MSDFVNPREPDGPEERGWNILKVIRDFSTRLRPRRAPKAPAHVALDAPRHRQRRRQPPAHCDPQRSWHPRLIWLSGYEKIIATILRDNTPKMHSLGQEPQSRHGQRPAHSAWYLLGTFHFRVSRNGREPLYLNQLSKFREVLLSVQRTPSLRTALLLSVTEKSSLPCLDYAQLFVLKHALFDGGEGRDDRVKCSLGEP